MTPTQKLAKPLFDFFFCKLLFVGLVEKLCSLFQFNNHQTLLRFSSTNNQKGDLQWYIFSNINRKSHKRNTKKGMQH